MKLLRVLHYLVVFHTTVPLLLMALVFAALCGVTVGTSFMSKLRILLKVMEADDLINPKYHKEFWNNILS